MYVEGVFCQILRLVKQMPLLYKACMVISQGCLCSGDAVKSNHKQNCADQFDKDAREGNALRLVYLEIFVFSHDFNFLCLL